MSTKINEIITQKIIEKIEKAISNGEVLPWNKPWTCNTIPVNYITQRPYRGVNCLLLDSGEYVTWSQICDLQKQNAQVKLRKGSKSQMVVFFSFKETTKEVVNPTNGAIEQKEVRIPFLRYYKVFNISDVDGVSPRRVIVQNAHTPVEQAESIIKDYTQREKIQLIHSNGDKACYSPVSDTITLPPKESFINSSEYYSTLFHELTHSTGNAKRLGRISNQTYFGDEAYSKEELVAEMGAAMLCGQCGIDNSTTLDNSVAYLQGWLKAIRDDITLIISASSKAQKAVDFLLGVEPNT